MSSCSRVWFGVPVVVVSSSSSPCRRPPVVVVLPSSLFFRLHCSSVVVVLPSSHPPVIVLLSLSSSHRCHPPVVIFLPLSSSSRFRLPPVPVVVPQSLSSLLSSSLSCCCPLLLFPSCPLSSFPSCCRHSPVVFVPPFLPREQLLAAVVRGAVVVFVPVVLLFGRPHPRSTRCPPCEQWLAAVGAGAGYWVAFLVVPLLSFP